MKDLGGVLVKSMQELSVEALPDKIPHKISVDISKLAEIGQTIRVEDLAVPAEVKVLIDGRTAVATVAAKVTEEQEAASAPKVPLLRRLKLKPKKRKRKEKRRRPPKPRLKARPPLRKQK